MDPLPAPVVVPQVKVSWIRQLAPAKAALYPMTDGATQSAAGGGASGPRFDQEAAAVDLIHTGLPCWGGLRMLGPAIDLNPP